MAPRSTPVSYTHLDVYKRQIHARETEKLKRRLNEIYVKHTGNDYEKVEAALERDNFMSAEDAKEWGLIDEILESRGKADEAK